MCPVKRRESEVAGAETTDGQLGNGTKTDSRNTAVYVKQEAGGSSEQSALDNVKAISAEEFHACALLNDGTVKCWGRNDKGQLAAASSSAIPGKDVTGAVAVASDTNSASFADKEECGLRGRPGRNVPGLVRTRTRGGLL